MDFKQVVSGAVACVCMIAATLDVAAENNSEIKISAGENGFSLSSPDGDFVLKIRGYIHSDGRFFLESESPAVDTFTIRRARPILEGTLYKIFDFRIIPDFGGGQTVLQDAHIDARFHPAFKVRFGKSKSPFGLERLQSATDITFIERSLATALAPNRDLGIHIYGDIGSEKSSYTIAVLNGVPDGASADQDSAEGKEFVGRIFFNPLDGLGAGIAYSYGTQDGFLASPNLPPYRTSGQQTFFRYRSASTLDATTIASGSRIRFSPQAYYYGGPVGILAEYVSSSQQLSRGVEAAEVKNHAWNVTASYVLTGEKASFKAVSPENAFNPGAGHYGAFEIAFRFSQLDIDDDAFPVFADPLTAATKASNWAAGINWYLNRNVKFVLNYDNTTFDGGSFDSEKLFLSRVQIAF